MAELAVGIAFNDGGFKCYETYNDYFRRAALTPAFLDGDIKPLEKMSYIFVGEQPVPVKGGFVLVDERSKTITQWGMIPGANEIEAEHLGFDPHQASIRLTPAESKIRGFISQKIHGADYGGVRESKTREILRPYISEAYYFPDLLADMVTKKFDPLDDDVAFVNMMQELAWDGKTRGWLTEERPNFVSFALKMPGWTLNTIRYEQIADLKEALEKLVELDDECHEAWQILADDLGYELPTAAFKI